MNLVRQETEVNNLGRILDRHNRPNYKPITYKDRQINAEISAGTNPPDLTAEKLVFMKVNFAITTKISKQQFIFTTFVQLIASLGGLITITKLVYSCLIGGYGDFSLDSGVLSDFYTISN